MDLSNFASRLDSFIIIKKVIIVHLRLWGRRLGTLNEASGGYCLVVVCSLGLTTG
jgi:hypothetical protein